MSWSSSGNAVKRTYENAISILIQQRRTKRPTSKIASDIAGLDQMPTLRGQSDMRGTPSIVGMKDWLRQIGHSSSDINKLNIIHVAGTKGKGSTCAFINSFLQSHSQRSGFPRKTGLYTGPHLISPEERIRINMQPLHKDVFAKYFFEVYDDLFNRSEAAPSAAPRLLQLYFLLAIHTFIREGVDAAIIETHHGGEYDATNVIERPVVTAITSLGLDHVQQLGPSLENIAWHKAGILKPGAAAFSVTEEPHIAQVLEERAAAKGVNLTFIDSDPALPSGEVKLEPDVQRLNSSLALAVVRSFLKKTDPKDPGMTPDEILDGVRRFHWPGRFQIVKEGQNCWYLDGAHNEMSIRIAAKWFIDRTSLPWLTPGRRILIFGQLSDQRDSVAVVRRLADAFDGDEVPNVIFTHYDPNQLFDGINGTAVRPDFPPVVNTSSMEDFSKVWLEQHPDSRVLIATDVHRALALAREQAPEDHGVHTLVTGSQHVIGGALHALGREV